MLRELEKPPAPGPGRDDPWGIIRNVVYKSPTPLTAPTSIPHLFYTRDVDWFHADGNTRSLLERNVAQGIALGAKVDPSTKVSTFVAKNIVRLQEIVGKLNAPRWPADVFGAIDDAKAKRGEVIYSTRKYPAADGKHYSCLDCHASRQSQLFSINVIGTDPIRAKNFGQPLNGKPFYEVIEQSIPPIVEATFRAEGVPLGPTTTNEWRATGQYVARQLDGIWATAPYLHNGSVPTLYHLLLPTDERPTTFHLGHRSYDPMHIGYEIKVNKPVFTYNSSSVGGSNAGHEFGTKLSDSERWDLIEYLKTL